MPIPELPTWQDCHELWSKKRRKQEANQVPAALPQLPPPATGVRPRLNLPPLANPASCPGGPGGSSNVNSTVPRPPGPPPHVMGGAARTYDDPMDLGGSVSPQTSPP